jgi:hypothetical protein
MEKVYSLVERYFYALPANNDFERGFFAAMLLTAAIFLLLLLLCLILKIIFRKPAVPGVTLPREDGDIFISRNAIFSTVSRLEEVFPELEISKITLHRSRSELAMTVSVLFYENGSPCDALAGNLKQRIFETLKNKLGIDTVKSVSVILVKAPVENDPEEDKVSAQVNPGNGFISGV